MTISRRFGVRSATASTCVTNVGSVPRPATSRSRLVSGTADPAPWRASAISPNTAVWISSSVTAGAGKQARATDRGAAAPAPTRTSKSTPRVSTAIASASLASEAPAA